MSKQVLIIDDEPNVRLAHRVALETEGFGVTEAAGGLPVLKVMEEGEFDLVLLDLRMPGLGGLTLLEEMRKRGIAIPTVIVTAYGDVPDAVRALKLGAIDFLQKPLMPETLRGVVARVVARHEPHILKGGAEELEGMEEVKRLLNLCDLEKAKAHLVHTLRHERDPDAFNLAGVLFEAQGDHERARTYFEQALALDPNYEPAIHNLQRIEELEEVGSSAEPVDLGQKSWIRSDPVP
jgi:DNA-binding NtrC family response regulator